eukprot:GHVH01008214.1.p1 GENE.GHVH01008214.1~~GHVH01008214.1.p1  ORF type:complete len:236 (+),score=26.68 GHVH01008214.1:188-895(+)
MSEESNFSLTTFSSNGKLLQIEHALNAVMEQGKPSLGIRANNGVVVICDKKLTALMDPESFQKCVQIDEHVGMTYSGMPADFRVVLSKARKEAHAYKLRYAEPIPIQVLVSTLADIMQEYTQSGGVRPFGVSLLVAGGTKQEGPKLFQVDPSGVSFAWKATAIGKDSNSSKAFLEKRYNPELELEDATHIAILTMRESFEGQLTENAIEIGVLSADFKWRSLLPSEIKDYLTEVE